MDLINCKLRDKMQRKDLVMLCKHNLESNLCINYYSPTVIFSDSVVIVAVLSLLKLLKEIVPSITINILIIMKDTRIIPIVFQIRCERLFFIASCSLILDSAQQ